MMMNLAHDVLRGAVLDTRVDEEYALETRACCAVLVELLGDSSSQRTVLSEHEHILGHEDAVGVPQQLFGLQVLQARRYVEAQLATVSH